MNPGPSLVAVITNPPANAGDTGLIPDLRDPTCHGTIKPVCHNYCVCALEPGGHNYWAYMSQLLKAMHPKACTPQQEKTLQWEALTLQLESCPPALDATRESPHSNKI